jgi:hypothetical protein
MNIINILLHGNNIIVSAVIIIVGAILSIFNRRKGLPGLTGIAFAIIVAGAGSLAGWANIFQIIQNFLNFLFNN